MRKRKYLRKPFRPINHETFLETRILARLTQKEAAEMLHVTTRTIHNWETGKVKIPYSVFRLLRISTGFELPGAAWRGWKLFGDALWSPDGKKYAAADLSYLSLTFAMARQFRLDYAKRHAQRAARSAQRRGLTHTLPLFSGAKR